MWYTSRSSFILDIFYEGKIEEAGKQPKRSEPIQVKQKILQESNNHGLANTKISCSQLKTWKDFEIHRRERDKGKNRSPKHEKFLYQSWEGKKWISKNAFVLIGKTCPKVRAITRMTNQNYQTMLALLKKIIILKTNVCGKPYQIEECPYLISAHLSQWQ